MYRIYRKKYNGGNRQTRALRAKVRKAEKTKTTLKILLSISLAALLALGGWLVYDHYKDNQPVPPAQIEQEVEDDSILTPEAGNGSSDSIIDSDDVTTPETGDGATGDETTTTDPEETTGDETTSEE